MTVAQLAGVDPLGFAPTQAGAYTVLATFPGSTDYSSGSAVADFTISQASPAISVSGGGTFDGSAIAASATVAGVDGTPSASLEGVAPSLVYYSGTYTTAAQLDGLTALAGAPTAPGSYTVLASFAGSTDYAPESSLFNFAIARATPTVAVADTGGIYNTSAFAATATVAGVVVGVDSTPSASLEGASPSLTYYSGTYTGPSQLAGLSPLAGAAEPRRPVHGRRQLPRQHRLRDGHGTAQLHHRQGDAPARLEHTHDDHLRHFAEPGDATGRLRRRPPGDVSPTAPGPGAILDAGAGQKLSVTFTPSDAADYNTATKSTTITVNPATPMLTVSAPGGDLRRQPDRGHRHDRRRGRHRVAGRSPSLTPTLTYYDGTGTSGTDLGSTPPTMPGTYTVVVSIPPSPDYNAPQPVEMTFDVAKGTPSVALTSSAGSAVAGQPVTFVARVAVGSVPATGTVTFFAGSTPLGTATLDSSGQATLTTSALLGRRERGDRQLRRRRQRPRRHVGGSLGVGRPGGHPDRPGAAADLQEEEGGVAGPGGGGPVDGPRRRRAHRHGDLRDPGEVEEEGDREGAGYAPR